MVNIDTMHSPIHHTNIDFNVYGLIWSIFKSRSSKGYKPRNPLSHRVARTNNMWLFIMNCVMHDEHGALNTWIHCQVKFLFFSFLFVVFTTKMATPLMTRMEFGIDWMQHNFAIVDLWELPLECTCNFPFGILVGRSHKSLPHSTTRHSTIITNHPMRCVKGTLVPNVAFFLCTFPCDSMVDTSKTHITLSTYPK